MDMDEEFCVELEEPSLGKQIAKEIVVSFAATVGTVAGFLAIGFVVSAIRAAAKNQSTQDDTQTES